GGSDRRFKTRERDQGGGGGGYDDDDEQETEERSGAGRIKKSDLGKKERRAMIKVRKIAKKGEPAPDEPLTFGNFLRYLIIAAIIIALIIFIGGQALQLGKGME
ncbi:hypothetical protein OAQ84_01720, partial [Bdellovibrionales bacterium]|nr:hypothetical protein [Bdellovibrionales bacterium]